MTDEELIAVTEKVDRALMSVATACGHVVNRIGANDDDKILRTVKRKFDVQLINISEDSLTMLAGTRRHDHDVGASINFLRACGYAVAARGASRYGVKMSGISVELFEWIVTDGIHNEWL